MNAVSISIIIPIYNAEAYLTDCLKSIQGQTFTDFEVLLVNDGSQDNSGKICDAFTKQDPRFHVIHKTNGGVSSARNAGLELANARWICFMDSDDKVTSNYLKDLYDARNEKENTLIIQGFLTLLPDNTSINRNFSDEQYDVNTIHKAFDLTNLNRLGFPFAKLFDIKIINQYHIRFIPEIHYWEDKMFLWEYMTHIHFLRTISGMNYHYYIRNNGNNLSSKISTYESEIKCYHTYYDLTRILIKKFNLTDESQRNINSTVSEALIRRSIGALYQKQTRKPYKDRIKLLKNITDEQIAFVKNITPRVVGFIKQPCICYPNNIIIFATGSI